MALFRRFSRGRWGVGVAPSCLKGACLLTDRPRAQAGFCCTRRPSNATRQPLWVRGHTLGCWDALLPKRLLGQAVNPPARAASALISDPVPSHPGMTPAPISTAGPHQVNAAHVAKPQSCSLERLILDGLSLEDLLQEPMDAYEAAPDGQASPPHVASPGVDSQVHGRGKRIREPTPSAQSIDQRPTRKQRKKERKREQRKAVRQERATARAADPLPVYQPAPFIASRYGMPDFKVLPFNADLLPSARTVFVGKHLKKGGADMCKVFTLAELKKRGIAVVMWDGVCVSQLNHQAINIKITRTPMAILDNENRIIAILAGRPSGDWDVVMNAVEDAFVCARVRGYDLGVFQPGKVADRRGDFPKLFSGFSFGTGQSVCFKTHCTFSTTLICIQEPASWMQEAEAGKIVEDLTKDANVVRVAGFQNSGS